MAPPHDAGSPGKGPPSVPKKHNLRPRPGRTFSQNSLEASSRINKNSTSSSMRGRPTPGVGSRDLSYASGDYNANPNNALNVVGVPRSNVPLTHHSWSNEDLIVEYDYDRGARYTMHDYFTKFTDWTTPALRDITSQLKALREEVANDTPLLVQLGRILKNLRISMASQQQQEALRDEQADDLVFNELQTRDPDYKRRIDDTMAKVYRQHCEEASRRDDNRHHEKQQAAAVQELTLFQKLIKAEILRTEAVEFILLGINDRCYPDGKRISDRFPIDLIERLFAICRSHDRKRRLMFTLRSFFGADGAIPDHKRDKILMLVFEYYTESNGKSWTFSRPSFSRGSLESLAAQFLSEEHDFERLLANAKRIVTAKTIIKQDDPETVLNADDLIRPKVSLLGSGMTADQERAFLSIVYTKQLEDIPEEFGATSSPKTNHDVLTDFFTSPDIFNGFMPPLNCSLKEFTDKVNTLIVNPMADVILEAFLGLCHKNQELFRITAVTRRIVPQRKGWEASKEHPVAGPSRKINFSNAERPSGIDKVEQQLLACADDEFDVWRQVFTVREFQSKMLELKQPLLGGLIKRSSIGLGDLHKFLSYWSSIGRFFIFYSPKSRDVNLKDLLDTEITIVRNGWRAGYDPEFRLNPSLDIPERPIELRKIEADVEAVFTERKVNDSLALGLRLLTEHVLYAAVYNHGRAGAFLNEGVSRNSFHAFLRECNVRNRLFKVRRDGTVTIITEGRSISGQNNNRNSVR
ncbi:hypothetical protein VTL71DRAFT_2398 [Oculimacula yallundae]|uniref:Uncharacterized protein n=1 Tax=Oculimacula yallundae TaxID=86028 RepID=A0ABR4C9H7_9HELO